MPLNRALSKRVMVPGRSDVLEMCSRRHSTAVNGDLGMHRSSE